MMASQEITSGRVHKLRSSPIVLNDVIFWIFGSEIQVHRYVQPLNM